MADYRALVKALFADHVVAFYPALARAVGGVKPALLLGQLLYWHYNATDLDSDGFFCRSGKDIAAFTALSADEIDAGRKILAESSIIETRLSGVPPTYHYRVILDRLAEVVAENDETQAKTSPNSNTRKSGIESGKVGVPHTEDSKRGEEASPPPVPQGTPQTKTNSHPPELVDAVLAVAHPGKPEALAKAVAALVAMQATPAEVHRRFDQPNGAWWTRGLGSWKADKPHIGQVVTHWHDMAPSPDTSSPEAPMPPPHEGEGRIRFGPGGRLCGRVWRAGKWSEPQEGDAGEYSGDPMVFRNGNWVAPPMPASTIGVRQAVAGGAQ
jgi:hypothetical protein